MKKIWQTMIWISTITLLVNACSGQPSTNELKSERMAEGITGKAPITDRYGNTPFPPSSVQPLQRKEQEGVKPLNDKVTIPFISMNGKSYIAVNELMQHLQYENSIFDAEHRSLQIGDKDVLFRLTSGSRSAEKLGKPFMLSEAPQIIDGRMLLPVSAVADLFQEEVVFEIDTNGLILHPSDSQVEGSDSDAPNGDMVDDSLDFQEEPAQLNIQTNDVLALPVIKNVDLEALVQTSKQYLGVKYQFGAPPYAQSKRFDCSSYTQHVFGKYGVKLPRLARDQAAIGQSISRKSLLKGDLLFFYVPGRFKSNNVVGHVGIYIGNQQMIDANSEPRNGVQIRSIDKAYWKDTFLKAKRVVY
jgi:hypothetical protein